MASEAMNESLRQEKEGQEGRLRALELQVTQLKDNAAEAEAAAHKAKALVVRAAAQSPSPGPRAGVYWGVLGLICARSACLLGWAGRLEQ